MNRAGNVQIKVLDSYAAAHGDSPITVDITDAFKKGQWIGARTWFLKAVLASGSGNLDVDILVSMDGGTNKEECISFTQLNTDGHELKAETIPVNAQKIYAYLTVSSSAHYTIDLWVSGQAVGAAGN